jgi:hypothetical protein
VFSRFDYVYNVEKFIFIACYNWEFGSINELLNTLFVESLKYKNEK